MKLNWKLRLQNKTTLVALIGAAVALIYQLLGAFGVIPGIAESKVIEIVGLAVNVLTLLGIVVDPTTKGVEDSERAMTYEKPAGTEGEH